MKSKEFELFINKTSKIIERALETNVDVMGSYFDDEKDDSSKANNANKGDKI